MKDIYKQLDETSDPQMKMELLLRLSKGFLNSDFFKCEEVAHQLLLLSKEYQMPVAAMHHSLVMGRLKYRQGELDKAKEFFAQAEATALATSNDNGRASCLEACGMILNKQGRHAEALELIQQAFAIYKSSNAHNGHVGLAYNNIANTYNYMHQTDEAEKYYRLAIETLENSERKGNLHFIKSNLGLILYKKNQFAEALQFLESGLEGFVEHHNIQGQSQAYSHIAHCYLVLGQHAQALIYFQKGLKLIRTSNLDNELSHIYEGLGQLYIALAGYADALKYLNKALKIRLNKAYWALACETYKSLHTLHTLTQNNALAQQALADGKALSSKYGLTMWQHEFEKMTHLPNNALG